MSRITVLCLLLLLAGWLSGASADRRGKGDGISDLDFAVLSKAKVAVDTDSLIEALASHPDPLVRTIAAEVLGLRGEERARSPLFKALKGDPDQQVRQQVALALARMGEASGRAALRELLQKASDPVSRVFLAALLAEAGEADGYRHVCDAARSESRSARFAAAESLTPFFSLYPFDTACELAPAELLLSLTDDKDPGIRYTALLFLPTAVNKGGLSLEAARTRARHMAEKDTDAKVRAQAEFVLEAWRLEQQERERKPGGVQ
jgi:HEAT repeat protein